MALRNDLVVAMNNPAVCLYSDEFLVVIADAFPKSVHHYLVIPKEDIRDVSSLEVHHIPTLIYMELKGIEFVMRKTGLPARSFHVGYHAYPSMNRLHLHLLTKDFNSVHLQLPFQWNSFHTEFFLPTYKVIFNLQTLGKVELPPNKKCLNRQIQCHECSKSFFNDIHNLKQHLAIFHNQLPNVC